MNTDGQLAAHGVPGVLIGIAQCGGDRGESPGSCQCVAVLHRPQAGDGQSGQI